MGVVYADEPASLLLARSGGRVNAATFADALPESLTFLRSHLLPAFGHALRHATADTVARATVESESADENSGERQES